MKYIENLELELDEKLINEIDNDIKEDVAGAVERYEASRDVDPLDCFDYMYAELPAELLEQREEFAAAIKREGHGLGH